jgi:cyanate permease
VAVRVAGNAAMINGCEATGGSATSCPTATTSRSSACSPRPSTATAAGIALINAFGNLAGFAGPYVTGWLEDLTGSLRTGLWVVAGLMIVAGLAALRSRRGAAA